MRLVLDTNVVVAAMRSPSGASAAILRAGRRREVVLVANVALAIEYEAVCLRQEHVIAADLSTADVHIFLDAVIAMIEPVETHFMWRPLLRDPADELVLEAAINGRAGAIVTFNGRDFGRAPSRFGIEVLTPARAIRRIRS
jgi:putative PIN family toxin of toxin-antitoxin system